MEPTLILINPWIYDFAAYDLWSKPLGLLYLAGFLRKCGFRIDLIDCMDIYHPGMINDITMKQPVRRAFGTGKFWKKKIPTPGPLKHISRPYSRYGISRKLFMEELKRVEKPSAILVTSLMTYWYPGVREAITIAKEIHPGVPVILGGIYARLCRDHALEYSGADYVSGETSLDDHRSVRNILKQFDIYPDDPPSGDMIPYPSFEMLHRIDYICIMTSSGCPYNCSYCASRFLQPSFTQRNPEDSFEEISYWHRKYNVLDFAFYDDALLVNSERHAGPLMEKLVNQMPALRFHTPNALHVREISEEIAFLMHRSGFKTIRLGLETSDQNLRCDLDAKVSEGEFEAAVNNLIKAGFSKEEIGAYILTGLPGQSTDSVIRTIEEVDRVGATPYLAEYSPIPHTRLWTDACAHSSYDLENEPLFHNNTLLPCWDENQRRRLPELKRMVWEIRKKNL